MAAPITHIVLTEKVFNKYFPEKDKRAFYVGTSFPDIRYLGVIDREKTHFHRLNLEDVQGEKNDFVSGMKFHSLIDEVRETFVVENKIYEILPESPFVTQALKLLEDKVLFEKVENWTEIRSYFEKPLDDERSFGIADSEIQRWHEALLVALSQPPKEADINKFIQIIGRPNQMSEEINKIIDEYENNEKILKYIEALHESIENLIQKSE